MGHCIQYLHPELRTFQRLTYMRKAPKVSFTFVHQLCLFSCMISFESFFYIDKRSAHAGSSFLHLYESAVVGILGLVVHDWLAREIGTEA